MPVVACSSGATPTRFTEVTDLMADSAHLISADFERDWTDFMRSWLLEFGFPAAATLPREEVSFSYWEICHRMPHPRPRKVVCARTFTCPESYAKALRGLESAVVAGTPLLSYMSRSIAQYDSRDGLLYDWNIYHFHLGTVFDSARFRNRTGPVLFAYVTSSQFCELKVGDHGDWADAALLETVIADWPELLEKFRIGCAVGLETTFSPDERMKLRKAGVTAPVMLSNGGVYVPPGGGVSTSGHSMTVTMDSDRYFMIVRRLQQHVTDNAAHYLSCTGSRLEPAVGATLHRVSLTLAEDGFRLRNEETGAEVLLYQTGASETSAFAGKAQ